MCFVIESHRKYAYIMRAAMAELLNTSPLFRKCESRRRFNPEPGTSAHPAGRQQLSGKQPYALKRPAPTIMSSRLYMIRRAIN